MRFLSFFLIFILLVCPAVLAVGISPPGINFEYRPGEVVDSSFVVINNRDYPMKATVKIVGDLEPFIEVVGDEFLISPKSNKEIKFKVHMSEDMLPGTTSAKFEVLDHTVDGGGMFSVKTGVRGRLSVKVPYPGKYGLLGLSVENVNAGEPVSFKATIENRGTDVIESSIASVLFYDSSDKLVAQKLFDNVVLESKEKTTLVGIVDGAEFGKGVYRAVFTYDYGEVKSVEQTFVVGSYELIVTNTSDYLYLGEITPLLVDVKSNWNGLIEDAFVTAAVDGKTYSSQKADFDAFEEKELLIYVEDDNSRELGGYVSANIVVNIDGEDSPSSKSVSLLIKEKARPVVEEPSIFANGVSTTVLLALAVVILIIVNAIFLMKKK